MYEVEDLILEIEKYPCLWKLPSNSVLKRSQRDEAWEEVAKALHPEWDDLDSDTKQKIKLSKKKQWNNIRDGFRKYLIRIKHNPEIPHRKYTYQDCLHFMIPILKNSKSIKDKDNDGDQDSESSNSEDNDDVDKIQTSKRKSLQKDFPISPYPKKRYKRDSITYEKPEEETHETQAELTHETLKLIKEKKSQDESYQDEDSLFLLSFKKDIKSMTRAQKLQFKMGMVKLIQNILQNNSDLGNQKRNGTQNRSASSCSLNFSNATLVFDPANSQLYSKKVNQSSLSPSAKLALVIGADNVTRKGGIDRSSPEPANTSLDDDESSQNTDKSEDSD